MKLIFVLFCFAFVSRLELSAQGRDTLFLVHFASNQAGPDAAESMLLATYLDQTPGAVVTRIDAHTDTVGSAQANMRLSVLRRLAVLKMLKPRSAIGTKCIMNDFGELHPVSLSDNAMNRRVEITIQLPVQHPKVQDTIANGAIVLERLQLDKLYFQPDVALIEPASLPYVNEIASMVKSYGNAKFEIRGHVNCPLNVDPNSAYMQKMNALSEDRARVIYQMLIEKGIPADKMSYRGMGNTEMVYPDARTDQEKRRNMRVEIIVVKDSL